MGLATKLMTAAQNALEQTTEEVVIRKEKHLEKEEASQDEKTIYKIEVPANRWGFDFVVAAAASPTAAASFVHMQGSAMFLKCVDRENQITKYQRMERHKVENIVNGYLGLCDQARGCASSGNLKSGQVVHDVVAWSSVIDGLSQQGRKQKASELFHLMRLSGMHPNQFTLASVVSAPDESDDLYYCKSIHACVLKFGYETEPLLNNYLITTYMNLGYSDDGFKVFDAMKYKDVVSWNALLAGYHENETSGQCQRICKEMVVEGFKPNIYTFVSILGSCSRM